MYNLNSLTKKEKICLAGLVGDLIGDGHLQPPPKNRLDYTSKYIQELKRFEKELNYLFKTKGKIRECRTNPFSKSYNYGLNNTKIALFLNDVGVPSGNKIKINFTIPLWISEDKEMFRRFINRLFSCKACVDTHSPGIEIKMHKDEKIIEKGMYFFKQIKEKMNIYFDIKTTKPFLTGTKNKRKDGIITRGIRLKIRNIKSIKNYKKHIGFDNKEKQRKLNIIIR